MGVDAAAASDRLPWLADEPAQQPRKRQTRGVLAGAAAAIIAVAAGGFWFGAHSVQEGAPLPRKAVPATTVQLPAPRSAEPLEVRPSPQPEVRAPAAAPEVRPAPVRELRIAPPPQRTSKHPASNATAPASAKQAVPSVPEQQAAQPVATTVVPKAAPYVPLKPWPARVIPGAAGRIVQIGAFGSIHQAKRGWWFMVREYPGVAHLDAVVRTSRNSHGRTFYRFQVGTTSQAHSEVLCQRMQKIHLSCAVVGLPWKSKVER